MDANTKHVALDGKIKMNDEFEGIVFMLVSMFAASIVTNMAAMKMKKK